MLEVVYPSILPEPDPMSQSVERSSLNLRYEGYRQRDVAREVRLLESIALRGIEEPLEGVDTPEARFLLHGFKRNRCASKLGIESVPYASLGEEEAAGILHLMRVAANPGLRLLEQARFLADLLTVHGMSVAEVARAIGRSKGWVSMRRGLLDEMSPAIGEILFRGDFPVYCYMYTLRPFMRMNGIRGEEVERFMKAVGGRQLERAGHPAAGGGLLPRAAHLAGGDRRRQVGVVSRPDQTPAGGPRRRQPARADAVERPREPAELPWAGDSRMPGRASWEPGLLRPGEPPDRGFTPHTAILL